MKSTLLTKINTVTPRNFSQQIEWMQGKSDEVFLKSFVDMVHKNADKINNGTSISVFTSKGSYTYTAYAKHIVRNDNNTAKKKYYAIS